MGEIGTSLANEIVKECETDAVMLSLALQNSQHTRLLQRLSLGRRNVLRSDEKFVPVRK
jgi:hypothetical protein